MSTVLEAMQAKALGMEVLGFSCLTNWAAGISSDGLDHADVLATGKIAASAMVSLLTASLSKISL
jgi:purine-nucleoside phosphorylase